MTDNISKTERSRVMAAVKSKDTKPELVVRRLVHGLGFRYRLHDSSLPGCPDLVFPRLKKIIFVNGCFWHLHSCGRARLPSSREEYWLAKLKRNADRDRHVVRKLRLAGWKVKTVWECQVNQKKLIWLKGKLEEFLRET